MLTHITGRSRVAEVPMHSGALGFMDLFLRFYLILSSVGPEAFSLWRQNSCQEHHSIFSIRKSNSPTDSFSEILWMSLTLVWPIIRTFLSQWAVMLWCLELNQHPSQVTTRGIQTTRLRMRDKRFPEGGLGCFSQKEVEWIQQKQWLSTE